MTRPGSDLVPSDLLALANAPSGALDEYDLVVMVGKFEYVPHAVLVQLDDHLAGGGNLFVASNEWATFRVRLGSQSPKLTTFKSDFQEEDPLYGTGNPDNDDHVAGVGMVMDGSYRETEIIGQTIWGGNQFPTQTWTDLSLHNLDEAGWLFAGTGLEAGDVLPGAFSSFGTGTLIDFDGQGEPFPVDLHLSGTPDNTLVWATAPNDDARAWWLASDGAYWNWPSFAGYATATWQQRPSGAEVVTLPSQHIVKFHIGDPVYDRILLNIVDRLSQTT